MLVRNEKAAMVAAFLGLAFLGVLVLGAAGRTNRGEAQKSEIEHGKYLVEEVAKCPECHTPRDSSGQLDRQAWLQGAPIWIEPVQHIQNWADNAPGWLVCPASRK